MSAQTGVSGILVIVVQAINDFWVDNSYLVQDITGLCAADLTPLAALFDGASCEFIRAK